MKGSVYSTTHAKAERASEVQINQETDLLLARPLIGQLLDSIPDIIFILNKHRQIVYTNQALVDVFEISDRRAIYGLRPGEALNCIHAEENIGGCGTTSFCQNCGAVNAILFGLRGKKKTEECRITQKHTGNAFDLRVTATPFKADNCSFIIFVATDISHEKRRNVLERTFFHDVANTLSSVVGYTDLIPISPIGDHKHLLEKLVTSVHRLQEEINTQRGLVDAESGELSVHPTPIRSLDFLHEILTIYSSNTFHGSEKINIDEAAIDIMFVSDKTLLHRIYGNMIKNALEASSTSETISVGCKLINEKHICFWVHNSQFIPINIRLQIYNRSFSTKGKGRGVGTYSMKLLSERYLKGKVAFSTTQVKGTIFSVTLPLILE